jgi:hypothetical protein
MTITPVGHISGTHRTGGLDGITAEQISEILGFKPNVQDDPDKVVNSWAGESDGKLFAIWDYKGSQKYNRFSVWGDTATLDRIFGSVFISER